MRYSIKSNNDEYDAQDLGCNGYGGRTEINSIIYFLGFICGLGSRKNNNIGNICCSSFFFYFFSSDFGVQSQNFILKIFQLPFFLGYMPR